MAIVTIPSFKVNASGTRYVAFYSANLQALVLANKAASASTWSQELIDAPTTGAGSYQSAAGAYASLLINPSNQPTVFYRSRDNYLKYFSGDAQ